VAIAAALLSGCGGSPANPGYLAKDSGTVIFLQWTRSGDAVTGSMTISASDPSSGTVQSQTVPISGTISGDSITLAFEGTNMTGTLSGSHLRLTGAGDNGLLAETDFVSARLDDFNAAVRVLQAQATAAKAAQDKADQEQAARQQAQDTLDAAAQALVNASSMLQNDITVAGDFGDASTFRQDADALRSAWTAYQSVAASEPSYSPSSPVPPDSDIQSQIACADQLANWFDQHPDYQPGIDNPPPGC
jgi:hypothetical protein